MKKTEFNVSFEIPFSKLKLGDKLGEGGFGIVYKASYLADEVAVKQLKTSMVTDKDKNEFLKETSKLINKERLNIKEDKELFHVVQILTAVAFRNFIEKFSKELSDEEAIHNFTIDMNLLKRGFYKQE